jgi:hypothetical protein
MANEARHFHRAKAKKGRALSEASFTTLFSVQVSTYLIRQNQTSPFFFSRQVRGEMKKATVQKMENFMK